MKRSSMFKYLAGIGFVLVAATGCLSSGIVSVGGGHYMLSKESATIFTTKAEITAEVYREAQEYCAQQGKSIKVIEDSSLGPLAFQRGAQGNIRFACE